ncbi:hypothetical protein BJ912DRAFT_361329 [Pholiota molesta]|nr:hypothetical protein BJ912DRAFT_361329 [Pholiota molesta]
MLALAFPKTSFKLSDGGLQLHGRSIFGTILQSEPSNNSPLCGFASTFNLASWLLAFHHSSPPPPLNNIFTLHSHFLIANLLGSAWTPVTATFWTSCHDVLAKLEQRSRGRRNADSKGRESFRRPLSPLRVLPSSSARSLFVPSTARMHSKWFRPSALPHLCCSCPQTSHLDISAQ